MVVAQATSTVQVLTLDDMRQIYRARFAMAKKLGFEAWFVSAFGSEEEWLGQFTVMPYDNAMEVNKQ